MNVVQLNCSNVDVRGHDDTLIGIVGLTDIIILKTKKRTLVLKNDENLSESLLELIEKMDEVDFPDQE